MRFTKAIFRNWIGIYLGLGLTELELDLSRCKNRMCLVFGENGSSKTTIMEGLTFFTDIYSSVREANDFIITDEEGNRDGYRELWCVHKGVTYISKVHWLSDKTKCFLFRKTEDGTLEDLNPNGNVRSYEEQLEIYLGLTKNHNKLLFLGPGLRDVISMIPSDRKNYISAFTPNIDVYLELHKTTAKYFSKLKNDISVITSEIHRLGDDRNRIETMRNSSKEKYDATIEKLQFLKSVDSNTVKTIDMLSVNGVPIVNLYQQKVSEFNSLCAQLNLWNIQYKNLCIKYNLSSTQNIQEVIVLKRDEWSRAKFQKEAFNQRYKELQDSLRNLQITKNSRASIKADYIQNNNPEKFIQEQKALNDELVEIQNTLQTICDEIPVLSDMNSVLFTKDDATKYLIFIDSIMTRIDDIQHQFSENKILEKYLTDSLSMKAEESEYMQLKVKLNDLDIAIQKKRDLCVGYEQSKDLADLITQIPSDCKNPSCPFIKKAKAYNSTQKNIDGIRQELSDLQIKREAAQTRLIYLDEYISGTISFFKAIRDLSTLINNQSQLISKFPDHEILMNPKEIFRNLVFILPRARRYSEYSYIHERYNTIIERLVAIQDRIVSSNTYLDTVSKMTDELQTIENQIVKMGAEIQQLYNENQSITSVVMNLENVVNELQTLFNCRSSIVTGLRIYDQSKRTLKSLRKHYFCGKVFTDRLAELRTKIQYTQSELTQYQADLTNAEYNLRRYDEFILQRESLSKEYSILEVLRKCWSPTTGIPLIFIEGFMNEFLKDANRYLKMIWSDEGFLIKGFNIDEKNFYITIDRGNSGFTCKDASKCSGAERAMLCTVLSLALLKRLPRTEDMFNITKFDEIDGVLDYEKKRIFVGILNDLLDEIGAEQSFLISHSDTFQSDVDVIILKGSDEYKARFLNGNFNIVYQY